VGVSYVDTSFLTRLFMISGHAGSALHHLNIYFGSLLMTFRGPPWGRIMWDASHCNTVSKIEATLPLHICSITRLPMHGRIHFIAAPFVVRQEVMAVVTAESNSSNSVRGRLEKMTSLRI